MLAPGQIDTDISKPTEVAMAHEGPAAPGRGQRPEDQAVARLAQRLRERRLALGITQADLADQLGVTPAYLSRLETGEATTQLRRLVRALSSVGLDLLALPRNHPAAREERLRPVAPPRHTRGTDVEQLLDALDGLDPSHIGSPELAERLRTLRALLADATGGDADRVRTLVRPIARLAGSDEALSIAHPSLRRVLLQVRDTFPEAAEADEGTAPALPAGRGPA
ncbi:helix-turn-helix transcriptional regulator [Cellulomonas sp. SLBN-39]|uniref:helix-turn-helix transcriptional regulator n=1 Tax=Cellulomonas sp. SLBN-39 TaxID=2768446 RepID=UPI001153C538|nr:helix-turn-helix transcriptional regulator [Cellulomonas sp. SLBN-39]TQL02677.1 HTH-type transcriptional regulator/antitoxin HipB [Cellulomonas sp. SLBN-39]